MTTESQEAEIKVADNVPYLTKKATGLQQYQTFEYKDVGVTLKIAPQMNQERFVRLKTFWEYNHPQAGTRGATQAQYVEALSRHNGGRP